MELQGVKCMHGSYGCSKPRAQRNAYGSLLAAAASAGPAVQRAGAGTAQLLRAAAPAPDAVAALEAAAAVGPNCSTPPPPSPPPASSPRSSSGLSAQAADTSPAAPFSSEGEECSGGLLPCTLGVTVSGSLAYADLLIGAGPTACLVEAGGRMLLSECTEQPCALCCRAVSVCCMQAC